MIADAKELDDRLELQQFEEEKSKEPEPTGFAAFKKKVAGDAKLTQDWAHYVHDMECHRNSVFRKEILFLYHMSGLARSARGVWKKFKSSDNVAYRAATLNLPHQWPHLLHIWDDLVQEKDYVFFIFHMNLYIFLFVFHQNQFLLSKHLNNYVFQVDYVEPPVSSNRPKFKSFDPSRFDLSEMPSFFERAYAFERTHVLPVLDHDRMEKENEGKVQGMLSAGHSSLESLKEDIRLFGLDISRCTGPEDVVKLFWRERFIGQLQHALLQMSTPPSM